MNSQELILGRIGELVEGAGFTFVRDADYGNTGVVRALNPDLSQNAAVHYDFQTKGCHFGPMSDRVAALTYGESGEGKARWVYSSIPELVEAVAVYLTTGRGAPYE
jgi:hypothetical protein